MSAEKKRFRIHMALTILVMVFIFVQSALSGDLSSKESNFLVAFLSGILDADPESISFWIRKGAHFTEYLVLGACLMLTCGDILEERHRSGCGILAWSIGAAYACTDEFHQLFVSDRSGELRDIMIDACGELAGVLIIAGWRRIRTCVSTAGQ